MSVLSRSPHGGNQIWVSLALKRVLEATKLGYLIVERPAHPPGSARRGRLPHVTERCPQVRPGQPAQSASRQTGVGPCPSAALTEHHLTGGDHGVHWPSALLPHHPPATTTYNPTTA